MIGTTITAISKSRTIISVVKEPVISGSGRNVVMAPNSTEGNKKTKMNIYAGTLIKYLTDGISLNCLYTFCKFRFDEVI